MLPLGVYHQDRHDQLRTHLADILDARRFAHCLWTLNGLTPYEYNCNIRTSGQRRFTVDPIHHRLGLRT